MRTASRSVSHDSAHRTAGSEERPAPPDLAPWIGFYEMTLNEGMRWMESWQQECLRFWTAGLAMLGARVPIQGDRLRRVSDMPWVPRVETDVIPLRRSTDPPGAEGTRIAMRVPLPWSVAGAEIIAINSFRGRETAAGETGQPGSEAPPSRREGQS